MGERKLRLVFSPLVRKEKKKVLLNAFTMPNICAHYVRKRFTIACNRILVITVIILRTPSTKNTLPSLFKLEFGA